ncbi:inovirus-type Gp2 protein [Acinetobacter baumannii]|uniref:YagK/YfjJ domain-containing protein n=1 Tax=Acinetobacter baumannii TaxID=470 RepID=UPI003AF67957
MSLNIQYDQLYGEAQVLAAVDYFIQEVCLGCYDLEQPQMKADLKQLVPSFKPIYNPNLYYCSTIQIFIELVKIIDYTLSLMPIADYDSIDDFDEMTTWHILNFTKSCAGSLKLQQMKFQSREYQNQQRLLNYTNALINHYARLLVVRVDLSILKRYQALYDIHAFNDALGTFLRRIADQDTCFSNLQGYAWALEHGITKGYHCHLLLMYDGNKRKSDYDLGEWVGKCWEQITHGYGYIFNCNHTEHKSIYERMGTLGIGMIHRNNDNEVNNLLNHVVPYLVNGEKEEQELRVKDGPKMRSFGTGQFNIKKRRNIA